jgi:hypothetical protein
MADRYQYRITLNGTVGEISDTPLSEQWQALANLSDRRGGVEAVYEERFVTDKSYLEMIESRAGHIVLVNGTVICPWNVRAELTDKPGNIILIGG